MNNWLNAHPTIKAILTISLKNAVNAVLTNGSLMVMLSDVFNVHSAAGWWNILKATASVIGAREGMIWIPKLLKWSTTNGA
jgi:hypothetical protein